MCLVRIMEQTNKSRRLPDQHSGYSNPYLSLFNPNRYLVRMVKHWYRDIARHVFEHTGSHRGIGQ